MTAGGMTKATDQEIRKIKELSKELLGHEDRLFSEISPPDTSAEARLMLGALHKVRNKAKPLAGAETQLVQMISDVRDAEYDGPPEPQAKKPSPVVSDTERRSEPADRTPIDTAALSAMDTDSEPEALEEGLEPAESEPQPAPGRTRRCVECGITKPISQFRKWGRGRKKECIVCQDAADDIDDITQDAPEPEAPDSTEWAQAFSGDDPKLIEALLKAAEPWTAITDDDLDALREGLIERGDFFEKEQTRWQQRKEYLLEQGRAAGYAAAIEDLKDATLQEALDIEPEAAGGFVVPEYFARALEDAPKTEDEIRAVAREHGLEEEVFGSIEHLEAPMPAIIWRIQRLALGALGLVAVVVITLAVLVAVLALS